MTKQTKITIASSIFLAVVVLHIFGILSNDFLAFISKPFIITTLVIIYLVSVKKPNFWYVSALFFSFWGDVLLLFKDQFFLFKMSNAYSSWISKSSKNLKSFDVTGFFIQNVKCILKLDIQSIKKLEIFRRYGFFHSKCQMHTQIGCPNHQKT